MFEALAASEYYHARNFYSIIERPPVFSRAGEIFAKTEEFEYRNYYDMTEKYCKEHEYSLAEGTYHVAMKAEKVHQEMLSQMRGENKVIAGLIYVRPICGHMMTEETKRDRCPGCGAQERDYVKYKKTENNSNIQ